MAKEQRASGVCFEAGLDVHGHLSWKPKPLLIAEGNAVCAAPMSSVVPFMGAASQPGVELRELGV